MQIFILDERPEKSAQSLQDAHVVKQTLETAQIISTALRLHGVKDEHLYKSTHAAHPWVRWAAQTRENFRYAHTLGTLIGQEYTFRFGRIHASSAIFIISAELIRIIPEGGLTPFPQCVPDAFKNSNTIQAYRHYYVEEKSRSESGTTARWTRRNPPEWYKASGKPYNHFPGKTA